MSVIKGIELSQEIIDASYIQYFELKKLLGKKRAVYVIKMDYENTYTYISKRIRKHIDNIGFKKKIINFFMVTAVFATIQKKEKYEKLNN